MAWKKGVRELLQLQVGGLGSTYKISLPWMLTVPFIIQVVTAVGLVGYLSYLNGQRSVQDLTNQLMVATGKRVEETLNNYLASPQLANQLISDAVRRGDLKLDLDHFEPRREQYLWQHMQRFSNLTWISIGTEQGDTLGLWRPKPNEPVQIVPVNASTQYFGVYYATNAQGQRTTQLKIERPAFDPRTRPWYKAAIAAREATWTDIYAGFTPGTIFIALSQPLFNTEGKLLGVSGIDISLLNIQKFLTQNPVSPTGQVFLMERSGLLVASSSQEPPFRMVEGQQKPQRVNALNSQNPRLTGTAQFLQNQFNSFAAIQKTQAFQFKLGEQSQFVQVVPFSMSSGLDWLIVIVVPESDVMDAVNAGTQTTFLLCCIALIAIIASNIWISHWLIKPIIGLSQASQHIARGDFSHPVETSQIQELSILEDSFSQMSREIQQSRQQLEEYSYSLEQKVNERTQALQQEVERRASVEAELQSVNLELQKLAYLDSLTQIANRRRFDERLDLEWRITQREQMPLSLILCDVDYFKLYNDSYGHQAGDDCLRQIAQVIARTVRRPTDLAARYGGEEFVVLLANTPLQGAMNVAHRIQTQVKDLQLSHPQSTLGTFVTLSLGVGTIVPTESTPINHFLQAVDGALYQAKANGRDRIAIVERAIR